MKLLKQIFHNKGYIDGITIINLEGEILFSAKLNSKLSSREDSQKLVGRNFFEVYENLDPTTSTTTKAMELGLPVYVENQTLKTRGQEEIRISSLSLPIKSGDRIVGAIDLSVLESGGDTDESSGTGELERIELSSANLSDAGAKTLFNRSFAAFTTADIIAVDEKMKKAKKYIDVVAACDLPVMIYGETGTGKEVFAQSIHNAGARREKPFIAQNCAALPDTLLESILFGTSKGAFTDATENKGLLELADGGTLFLDEINSMPLHLQSKLLRVLQDGHFRSIGAKEIKTVDVRIIAALNTEPQKAIEEGQLRRDIFYRLSMMSITIPPLRERQADIAHFIKYYVNKHNETFHKEVQYVSKELISKLEEYDWPGNVRELEHIIVYGMSMVAPDHNVLRFEDIEEKFHEMKESGRKKIEEGDVLCSSLRDAVDSYEKGIIAQTLEVTQGNISEAAKILDIPRQTLQRKVKQYQILS